MSVEAVETQEVVKQEREALFSKRRRKFVSDPLNDDNPITVQVLGICSALAVTTQIKPTLVMSIAVVFVIVFSNLIISLIRKLVPNRVRIIVQLAVIATLVTLVNEVLKAYLFDMYKQLSVFIGLIITNCIIMGRLEAFALGNKPWDSVLDGLGSGFGYAWIILAVAFFRELFGSGSIFGYPLYEKIGGAMGVELANNGLMVSSIGAFMVLGIIIWVQRTLNGYTEEN
ncbi:MAG TPA: NADH:ubiquinone reductase (Na(+)-transporting) subunit D [Cytophagales bacterium]|nr:NADH:ubiquinone reductase (Na(+)-transporting) subunit D [Cytophagales bacterium]HAA17994.1 NADH:ubiquinone reductase (Na(+)-transporting) subunit D [Cytophagales bacterium]HAP64739.1 NADH:ubiquinone reductase (Na(+)-transporting) subunit D [Cytophagales bacterium]